MVRLQLSVFMTYCVWYFWYLRCNL
jgi:hypothetical protein